MRYEPAAWAVHTASAGPTRARTTMRDASLAWVASKAFALDPRSLESAVDGRYPYDNGTGILQAAIVQAVNR